MHKLIIDKRKVQDSERELSTSTASFSANNEVFFGLPTLVFVEQGLGKPSPCLCTVCRVEVGRKAGLKMVKTFTVADTAFELSFKIAEMIVRIKKPHTLLERKSLVLLATLYLVKKLHKKYLKFLPLIIQSDV